MDFGEWALVVVSAVVIGGAFAAVLWPRKRTPLASTAALYGDSSTHSGGGNG
jgi:hypothetical protein